MRTTTKRWLLAAGVVAATVASATTLLAEEKGPKPSDVRAATARFHKFDRADKAGYDELKDAAGIACIDDPDGRGAMGVHYVNGDLVGDPAIDALHPEVLIYEPTKAGNNKLVAVEYVVLRDGWGITKPPPRLFGREFALVTEPNRYGLPAFYELHAWIWEHNPRGMFDDWNPRVGCEWAGLTTATPNQLVDRCGRDERCTSGP